MVVEGLGGAGSGVLSMEGFHLRGFCLLVVVQVAVVNAVGLEELTRRDVSQEI